MKRVEGFGLLMTGLIILYIAFGGLLQDYDLFNHGQVIPAKVNSEVDCGSTIKGSLCSYKVEYSCGKASCTNEFLTPLTLPFTGPEKGEIIDIYWAQSIDSKPSNFMNLWGHNLIMLILGLAFCGGGLRLFWQARNI